jgi:hypothetical protein
MFLHNVGEAPAVQIEIDAIGRDPKWMNFGKIAVVRPDSDPVRIPISYVDAADVFEVGSYLSMISVLRGNQIPTMPPQMTDTRFASVTKIDTALNTSMSHTSFVSIRPSLSSPQTHTTKWEGAQCWSGSPVPLKIFAERRNYLDLESA